MTGGFSLPPERLRAHAGKLDGHAEALGQAQQAIRAVQLGDDAYGILCRFMGYALNKAGEPVADALSDTQDAVSASASALRDAVAHKERIDADIADDLQRIATELGG